MLGSLYTMTQQQQGQLRPHGQVHAMTSSSVHGVQESGLSRPRNREYKVQHLATLAQQQIINQRSQESTSVTTTNPGRVWETVGKDLRRHWLRKVPDGEGRTKSSSVPPFPEYVDVSCY